MVGIKCLEIQRELFYVSKAVIAGSVTLFEMEYCLCPCCYTGCCEEGANFLEEKIAYFREDSIAIEDRLADTNNDNVNPRLGDVEAGQPELARQNSDEEIKVQYFHGIFKTFPKTSNKRLGLSVVWNSFFNQCYTQGIHAINANYVKLHEFQDREPYLFIGLPGLVIYVSLYRSAVEVETPGIVLTNGVEMTEDNRPGGAIGDQFWKPAIELKNLIKESKLTVAENSFVQYCILKQDVNDSKCKELLPEQSEERHKLLNQIIARANSMAISVSRLARYTRRFREVVERLGSGNNVGLVITGSDATNESDNDNGLSGDVRRFSMERGDGNDDSINIDNNGNRKVQEIEISSV
eukprot:g1396.t1